MSDGTINFPLRATAPDSPSIGRVKIWTSQSDGKPKITDENGQTVGFESIYGSDFSGAKEDLDVTNNTTSFQNYVTIPYSASEISATALYEINVSFVWGFASAANDFRGQLTLNNVQVGEEFRQEPKDGGADQRNYSAFTGLLTGSEIAAANGFIGFNFASSSGGTDARMFYCYLNFKRVK